MNRFFGAVCAVSVFLSAFLLFAVQPMAGKWLLPRFGGSAGVWTACLLFFQTALVAGYAYAHWLRWPRVHVALLIVSLAPLAWKTNPAAGGDQPTWTIFAWLATQIGAPVLTLASTSPLVQRWWSTRSGRPYWLYVLSNAGSLGGLLAYPVLIEPFLTLDAQWKWWTWAYVAAALFTAICTWSPGRKLREEMNLASPVRSVDGPAPPRDALWFWLIVSMANSVLLVATTAQLTQEVAATPFLWVLPLALYLASFILAFSGDRWYNRRWISLGIGFAIPSACAVQAAGLTVALWIHAAVYSITLFACSLACSGELARSKPDPKHLTRFYLAIAGGGAWGGAVAALIAPYVFTDYWEFPLSLAACAALILAAWYRDGEFTRLAARPSLYAPVAALALASAAPLFTIGSSSTALLVWRNFYGVLRINDRRDSVGERRVLTHGRVMHGAQYRDAGKRGWPTTYFGRDSGAGLVLESFPRAARPLRVGVIGLGAGTLAAYAQPGDVYRFYEVNPDVELIALGHFSFIRDSPGIVAVSIGDGRVLLTREAPQNFQVLAVDAFSSGSIPAHLLTVECADVYRRHLAPDGVLLLHISNHALDLAPVARALAARMGFEAVRVHSAGDASRGTSAATWMVITANRALLDAESLRRAASAWTAADRPPLAWTDDFSSLWHVLRF